MSTNPIWVAGYGTVPVAGASPVWIAGYGIAVAGASEAWIVGRGALPVPGATPVQIMGYGGPVAGASPIWIGGYIFGGSGGGAITNSVWSAADATAASMTVSNGGATITAPVNASVWNFARISTSHVAGKYYMEFKLNSGDNFYVQIGVSNAGNVSTGSPLGFNSFSWGENTNFGSISKSGFTGATTSSLVVSAVAGDVIGIALDFDVGKLWISYNNTWSDSGVPSTGTNPLATFVQATVGPLFAALGFRPQTAASTWTLQSKAATQSYAAPSGFTAWDGG